LTGWWLSSCTPVSSTNKTDSHDITKILLNTWIATVKLLRISTLLQGILGLVAPYLAAALYQGNFDRNQKLRNIVSTEKFNYLV